jgi:hypothetical protein
MIVAPRARRTATFSGDIFSGRVMIVLYPLIAPTNARPIPLREFSINQGRHMNGVRISAGGLDERVSGLYPSRPLCLFNHP